jgi:cytochrome c oxidase subunit 2
MIVFLVAVIAIAGCAQQAEKPAPAPEKPAPAAAPAALIEEGKKLYTAKGCSGCHGAKGEGIPGVGPELMGIYGTEIELQDGSKVKVDDAFIKESITNPAATVVKGFAPMPNLGVSDSEAAALLEYLKTL